VKRLVLSVITLGGVMAAAPALAEGPEEIGVLGAARESLLGDVYAEPSNWRPLTLSTFFSEGWNQAWASPPAGPGGAPRQGWIGAWDGVFYRLGISTFSIADDVNGKDQYAGNLTLYSPFSRRFELQTNYPMVVSNLAGPDTDRRSHFGDFEITPRFLLAESESTTHSFNLAFRTPTGDTRNGNDVAAVTPTWNFWSNPWQTLVVRGGGGITVPYSGFDAGARTTLLGNLAVGYYFTPHDRVPVGDFVGYVAANFYQPVDDRGSKRSTLTFTPGFRTHLGANFYLLGGFEVPVTRQSPFDFQWTAGLMKVF